VTSATAQPAGVGLRFAAAVAGLVALALIAFCVGRFPVSVPDVFRAITGGVFGTTGDLPSTVQTVILQVRAPRVIAAMLVGAALAAAGSAYQSMFRNPLVSPDILQERVDDPALRLCRRARGGGRGVRGRLGVAWP
jgi:ABC-type Fe3+-siderophore transport system permease subunit